MVGQQPDFSRGAFLPVVFIHVPLHRLGISHFPPEPAGGLVVRAPGADRGFGHHFEADQTILRRVVTGSFRIIH